MKLGDIMFTNRFEHRGGFHRRSPKVTFKAKDADTLLGYIYIGGITVDTAPHFSADGALAALGYGPIMRTIVQRRVVDALKTAREAAASLGQDELLEQADAALAAAARFDEAAAPTIDPIMKDAARFGALLKKLEKKEGSILALRQLLTLPDVEGPTEPRREALQVVIDAATQK